MAFKKGNKHGKGGSRKGAGRNPDWFKKKMGEIATKKESVKFVEDVITGQAVDEFLVLQTGVQVPVKADADTRLKFLQFATDQWKGKPSQAITGEDGGPLTINVVKYG